jgi:hypothetical protein
MYLNGKQKEAPTDGEAIPRIRCHSVASWKSSFYPWDCLCRIDGGIRGHNSEPQNEFNRKVDPPELDSNKNLNRR